MGLDPQSRRQIWEYIELLKKNTTIVLTTHYLEEADELADRIGIMSAGRIVALGSPATKLLLKTKTGISQMRGHWASFTDGGLSVPVMPTFHPAYLLRNYTPDTRGKVWSDMQMVMERLGLR